MRLGLYLGDQVWERTRSKGIYGYSRLLTSELLRRLRDHQWTLIVNRANRADMTPKEGDPRVVALPAACASGVPRLLADQVLATALSRSHHLDLLHFPKGFMPFLRPAPVTTVTLHDTIPLYYARHHPDVLPKVQLRYLLAAMRHSLREASAVVTDSEHSRKELAELAASAGADASKIEVCAPTPDPDLVRDPPPTETDRPKRLIHFGSLLPHKRTAETIRAFRAFDAARGGGWTLRVVGLDVPPAGIAPGEDVTFLGPVASDVLRREICDARGLLFLSSIEGFGLPALEAWFLGTPVCFTPGGALGEVLEGVPGRCETTLPDEVLPALDTILALPPEERARIRDALRARYGLAAFGSRMAELFDRWMGTSRR